MNENLDSGGMWGAYLHYGLVIWMAGLAMIIFGFLWKKGKLDLDEGPKWQMMKDEE